MFFYSTNFRVKYDICAVRKRQIRWLTATESSPSEHSLAIALASGDTSAANAVFFP